MNDALGLKITQRMRMLRTERSRTARETAEDLTDAGYPITHSTYRSWESSERNPLQRPQAYSRAFVDALCHVYGIPRTDIITEAEYASLPPVPTRYARTGTQTQNTAAPYKGQLYHFLQWIKRTHAYGPLTRTCVECQREHPCSTYQEAERLEGELYT